MDKSDLFLIKTRHDQYTGNLSLCGCCYVIWYMQSVENVTRRPRVSLIMLVLVIQAIKRPFCQYDKQPHNCLIYLRSVFVFFFSFYPKNNQQNFGFYMQGCDSKMGNSKTFEHFPWTNF